MLSAESQKNKKKKKRKQRKTKHEIEAEQNIQENQKKAFCARLAILIELLACK